ncbi:acyl-CoA/acyl-ACP dehydrogenase [Pseudomaricurvus alkylphenolicus]|jgi:alkylation response protein AidB-like acyl-CoA dehydrogenase|uniref:acyl-CoA dehydrogenase family protein n=1 Tax=Pseudomaricurvus alkylphenolicus TaxID=1306991 RepID=UPI00141DA456|nr:acyl-CoA dehydrogenase family protein [Pseudomaricurvus alkylphenolicus]NIB39218.1 acyl-CoA/acyl-ACP dehydrogenase [Pseudomaricurvus alkylphenolicus]
MDFAFTDEQLMIRDTAQAFLAEVSDSAAVRAAMVSEHGFDAELWQRICADMYWQAIHIPEQYGGMGLGYVELVAMVEQMGRFLLCSPFFSTVCLATNALLVAGTEEQKTRYLPRICEGMTATLAHTGAAAGQFGGQWHAEAVEATVTRDGDDYMLSGELRYVVDGGSAELLIVAAREPGSCGTDGISLFVVPADTLGINRQILPTMDQTRKLANISLDRVRVPPTALMGEPGQAWPQLQTIINLATVALAAEQMGGAQQVMDITVEYTKERTQFNRPIASFQAIKHKAADMMTQVEVARSGVYYAACVAQEALTGGELAGELNEAASVAKSYCSDVYFSNAGEAIQMHGGVGFTWEYDVHLYFKRAKASEHLLGNGDYHRERLAAMLLDGEVA